MTRHVTCIDSKSYLRFLFIPTLYKSKTNTYESRHVLMTDNMNTRNFEGLVTRVARRIYLRSSKLYLCVCAVCCVCVCVHHTHTCMYTHVYKYCSRVGLYLKMDLFRTICFRCIDSFHFAKMLHNYHDQFCQPSKHFSGCFRLMNKLI